MNDQPWAAPVLAGLAFLLAARTGAWREILLCGASALGLLVYLAQRHGRGGAAVRLCRRALALYALAVLFAFGLDQLRQVRLPQLVSPVVANPIEGREALKGWLLAQGQNIYPPPGGYPRLLTLYPPVFYVATAVLSAVTGPGLLCGKLAAAAGLALLLAALCGLGRRQGGAAWVGLLAALGFFALPEAGNGFLCKPDTWAFGLLLAGAWAFPAGSEAAGAPGGHGIRRRRLRLVLAGSLVAGGALAKQQVWPLALAFAVYAVFALPRRREAVWPLAGLGVAFLGLFLFFYVLFGPGLLEQTVAFPRHMSGLAADNSLTVALDRLGQYAAARWPLLVGYGVWLLSCLAARRFPLPDVLLVASLPFLVRTLMWSGSDANHFLFVSAVAALGVASLAGRLLRASTAGAMAAGVLALAVLVPARVTLQAPRAADFAPPAEAVAEADRVRAALAAVPGPVLMDAEGAYLFADRSGFDRLRLYDAFETDMYDRLGLAPILDSVMADDLRHRRVARFVDSQVFISTRLLALRDVYYEPAERIGRYAFFKPRPERAIAAMPVADRVERGEAGLRVRVTDARNVRQWGAYIQAEDPAAPLVLTYEAAVATPAASAYVVCSPRLTGPGQTVRVEAAAMDGRSLATATYGFGDFPESGEGFANRPRLHFRPETDRFSVTFTLTGPAQLWLDAAHPLVIAVD